MYYIPDSTIYLCASRTVYIDHNLQKVHLSSRLTVVSHDVHEVLKHFWPNSQGIFPVVGSGKVTSMMLID